MAMKPGRPTFYKDKMLRRTYQITAEHDQCIKEIAEATSESESSIIRLSIELHRSHVRKQKISEEYI